MDAFYLAKNPSSKFFATHPEVELRIEASALKGKGENFKKKLRDLIEEKHPKSFVIISKTYRSLRRIRREVQSMFLIDPAHFPKNENHGPLKIFTPWDDRSFVIEEPAS